MNNLCRSAWRYRHFILTLARRDLTAAYTGSVGGNWWVIVNPLVYVLLTLVLFQFAMKPSETHGTPYVAWVMPLVVFWTFATTVLNGNVGAIKQYAFLLRHPEFDLRLVTFIKILSASAVHGFLMVVVMLSLVLFVHVPMRLSTFLLIYYFLAMITLLIALGWLIASLGLFWKDIKNLVGLILQVEFWVNPIFWEPQNFPPWVAVLMYANPFYYPLHGYRASIGGEELGARFLYTTTYFWLLVLVLIVVASKVFKRLERHFGDVL